jgi:hypothetical protein
MLTNRLNPRKRTGSILLWCHHLYHLTNQNSMGERCESGVWPSSLPFFHGTRVGFQLIEPASPRSRASNLAMDSGSNSNENTFKFSSIRSAWSDLGSGMYPCCRDQRIKTWAPVLPTCTRWSNLVSVKWKAWQWRICWCCIWWDYQVYLITNAHKGRIIHVFPSDDRTISLDHDAFRLAIIHYPSLLAPRM